MNKKCFFFNYDFFTTYFIDFVLHLFIATLIFSEQRSSLSVKIFLSFPLDKNFINIRKKTMNLITLKLGKLNLTCIIYPKVLRFIVFRFNSYFGTLYSRSWISGQCNFTRFNRSCLETYDSDWDILWLDKKKISTIPKI